MVGVPGVHPGTPAGWVPASRVDRTKSLPFIDSLFGRK